MGRSGAETKARILSVAYELFYREGFARVSMDAVAAAAGVTKRTVYYHFESKDALAAAMLERQRDRALAVVQRWGGAGATSPAEFLAAVFEGLERWASKPRWLGSGYTRLSMELADLPGHPARKVARRHKREVEAWLAERLDGLGAGEPQERAREAAMLLEGCLCLMLVHGDRSYAAAAGRAASRLADRAGRRGAAGCAAAGGVLKEGDEEGTPPWKSSPR